MDKHDKGHTEIKEPVRYRQVDGDQTTIEGDEDAELWMESVQAEMLHSDDKKMAYEVESVGIQMGLATVLQVEKTDDNDEENEDSDSSMRHRIT